MPDTIPGHPHTNARTAADLAPFTGAGSSTCKRSKTRSPTGELAPPPRAPTAPPAAADATTMPVT